MHNDTTTDDRDTLIDIAPYNDDELFDRAMRELEVLERTERADQASKRGLETLRRCGSLRAFCKTFAVAGALAITMGLTSAASADEPRAKRPVVCTSGTPVQGDGFSGYLCTDGKKPRLFTRHMVVSFVDHEGNPASYVLGWTGAPVKP